MKIMNPNSLLARAGKTSGQLLILVCVSAACLALPWQVAKAQTATNAPSNPFTQVLAETVLDTNSSFFAQPGLELRAETETTLTSYQSVLSGTYFFTNGVGIGAELVNGALNVVDESFVTLEYGYGSHNLKVVPFAGIGYDFYNRGAAAEVGTRLEVALTSTGNMFATTDYVLEIPFHSQNTPLMNTFRLGVGWKF